MNHNSRYFVLLGSIGLAGGMLALLLLALPGNMPTAYADGTGTDPAFRAITVTAGANLWISDTAPYHGVTKMVYFNNASGSVLAVTHEISGTPTLTLTAPAAFGQAESVVTATESVTQWVIQYDMDGVLAPNTPVRYTAVNTNGVETAVTITFVRDVTAPVAGIGSPAAGAVFSNAAGTPITIQGTANDDGAGVQAVWVNSGSGWNAAAGTATWSYQWALPSANGVTYTVQVTAADWVHNTSTPQSVQVFVDNVPPSSLTLVPGTITSLPQVPLFWSADGATTYTIEYREQGSSQWTVWHARTTATADTFAAPSVDTVYEFHLTAYDPAGNSTQMTTTVTVPPYYVYLPVVLRSYASFCNGTFEQDWACWQNGGELERSIATNQGKGKTALLGKTTYNNRGGVPMGKAWMNQTFTVPQDGDGTLTIWYHLVTYDIAWVAKTGYFFDTFEISINKAPDAITASERNVKCRAPNLNQNPGAGNPVSSGLVFCAGDPTTVSSDKQVPWEGSQTITLDLSNFRGQTITLYFANYNREDGWYNTYTYVDDIELQ